MEEVVIGGLYRNVTREQVVLVRDVFDGVVCYYWEGSCVKSKLHCKSVGHFLRSYVLVNS